jgi:hypothetical protein
MINYASGELYQSLRKISSRTARYIGKVDKVIEFSPDDIPETFKEANRNIFSYKRGDGLWLWKPYFIDKVLNEIDYGDWLLYLDSGTTVIRDLHYIVTFLEKHGSDIFMMEQPLLSRQFTKRECYIKLGLEDHGENQIVGLMLLFKKTDFTISLVKEWLTLCEDEEMLSPNAFHPEIEEFNDFVSHREDQSILNLLRIKYNLPVYRDCSAHGEMPYMYCYRDSVYNPLSYPGCDYPTVILSNRAYSPYKYAFKYIIKKILLKLNINFFETRWLSNPPAIPTKK